MAEERVEVSSDGLERLLSAACDFARPEVDRIIHAAIEALRTRPAVGIFDDIGARHAWDEYCWAVQEGPFDDAIIIAGTDAGSIAQGLVDLLHPIIADEVGKQPDHVLVSLSALAVAADADADEDAFLGSIWIDGILTLITAAVDQRARDWNLGLIGPDRADFIRQEIEGSGFVWSMLDETEAMELLGAHVDEMVDPDGDLSDLADQMVETFLALAHDDGADSVSTAFLEHFDREVRSMLTQDVLTSLREARAKLLKAWDG